MSPPRGPGIRCRRNSEARRRRPQCKRDPPDPPLRDDAPDVLRRRVRHQPVDGHLDARRHPSGDEPMGEPAPDLQGTGPHRRTGRARRRAARHGLRRQRRPAGQRQGRRRQVRLPAARRRSRRLRRVDEPATASTRPRRATSTRVRAICSSSARSCWRAMDFAPTAAHTTRSPPPSRCRLSASNWSIRASIISTPRSRYSTTPPSPTTHRHSAKSRAHACSNSSPTPSR